MRPEIKNRVKHLGHYPNLSLFCCKFYCSFSEKLTKTIKLGIYRVFQTSRKMNICIAEKTVKSLVGPKKIAIFPEPLRLEEKIVYLLNIMNYADWQQHPIKFLLFTFYTKTVFPTGLIFHFFENEQRIISKLSSTYFGKPCGLKFKIYCLIVPHP